MERYVIALDAMGGDHAPDATVGGAVQALRRFEDISMILTGPKDRIEALLAGADDVRRRIEIVDCDEVITMDEHPMMAVRKKVNSSMVQAMLAVREKRAGAAVSAGSTGALLACGMLRVGRIPGIERPALAPVLPGENGPFLLIDSGANVDCQPKYLTQFGLMGSVYMSAVMGVKEPKVGLVNIGTETEKVFCGCLFPQNKFSTSSTCFNIVLAYLIKFSPSGVKSIPFAERWNIVMLSDDSNSFIALDKLG